MEGKSYDPEELLEIYEYAIVYERAGNGFDWM